MAITLVHPIDVCKSRLQLAGEGGGMMATQPKTVLDWLVRIRREEGVGALYRGLPAAYCLQFSVTATRFATYGMAKRLRSENGGNGPPNLALAALSGALGGLAGNPWFAIKTRHQVYSSSPGLKVGLNSDNNKPPESVFRAFANIARHEGVQGYFRGLNAFVPRVMVYGAVQLSTYDYVKLHLGNRFAASVVAALLSVCAIQPFDFLTARLQSQAVDPITKKGVLYSGPWDCLVKSVRAEGPLVVLKGFQANVMRFCPYTFLVLVFVEQLRIVRS
jgi:solute carrier family 25 protein 34/35